ncbi:MAG TPA: hypothetical protein VHQ46_02040 [Desulfobacteria bacterium]|nr:hypothetical protein [Desulfobacteria bacterium]
MKTSIKTCLRLAGVWAVLLGTALVFPYLLLATQDYDLKKNVWNVTVERISREVGNAEFDPYNASKVGILTRGDKSKVYIVDGYYRQTGYPKTHFFAVVSKDSNGEWNVEWGPHVTRRQKQGYK